VEERKPHTPPRVRVINEKLILYEEGRRKES